MPTLPKTPAVPVFKRPWCGHAVAAACGALALAAMAVAPVAAQQPVPTPPRLVDAQGADPAGPAVARRVVSAASAASASASASASGSGNDRGNARPHVKVIEDDNVRIEEVRARGQVQRITVQNKTGGTKDYDIIVTPGGKDTSQDRGAMGQRAWSLFEF